MPEKAQINDAEEINMTDELTMAIRRQLYNLGTTMNIENYYMSTFCAAHLQSKKVYWR
jgi:hypothetical protein